ncbi:MAG: 23S rRNA (pseudouridine(1915)-N(3))-methyltransferase RlmH [Ruminococcus sp.]|nr:23S rRNA (pseudouridine(1915)-N(3))-methyltransferase RlmH [Ruminococcus sp.]
MSGLSLNVTVIAVGKIKEDYLRQACGEYIKRLGAYGKAGVTEIPEARLPDNPSKAQINAALETEAKGILSAVPKGNAVIALCIEGKQLSSEEFSQKLQYFSEQGKSGVSVIIGSSFGLSETVKKAADLRLSMSAMTFPHQLARVMAAEQLYRAMSIANNGKYHK